MLAGFYPEIKSLLVCFGENALYSEPSRLHELRYGLQNSRFVKPCQSQRLLLGVVQTLCVQKLG